MKQNILSNSALSIALLNAMTKVAPVDVMEKFNIKPEGYDSTVDVTVLVNGVEVDLVQELAEFVQQVDDNLEHYIEAKAEGMIKERTQLYDLLRELEDAEYKIRKALNAIPE